MEKSSLTYKDAGVDVDKGNAFVRNISPIAKRTSRPEILEGIGGFAGLCEIPKGYQQPVLVGATDGVGTKLEIAQQLNCHHTIGIDLVAMCINDMLAVGAEPLFFLDYLATGALDVDAATQVVEGIANGCEQAGCALLGGETAEMPGFYQNGQYDIAGFSVGVVEKSAIINGKKQIQVGDQLIGLGSSGCHSNGYSLIRKIIQEFNLSLDQTLDHGTLGEALLAPTQIYVKALLNLCREGKIHGLAHITGGGLIENIPRILADSCSARLFPKRWPMPEILTVLQDRAQLSLDTLYRTFNCGLGMVAAVAPEHCQQVQQALREHQIDNWLVGEIIPAGQHRVEFSE